MIEILPPRPKDGLRIADIKQAVAKHYGVSVLALEGPNRHRSIARPRQVAMWLARRLTYHSTPTIAKHLGGRDHSTIVVGSQRIDDLIQTDPRMWDNVRAILEKLEVEKLAA